jgi:hypothetical protein
VIGREHITDDNRHQAEPAPAPRTDSYGNYVSPAYRRWAEQVEQAARPPGDTFALPTTPAELNALSYPDRTRVYAEAPDLYARLTGRIS